LLLGLAAVSLTALSALARFLVEDPQAPVSNAPETPAVAVAPIVEPQPAPAEAVAAAIPAPAPIPEPAPPRAGRLPETEDVEKAVRSDPPVLAELPTVVARAPAVAALDLPQMPTPRPALPQMLPPQAAAQPIAKVQTPAVTPAPIAVAHVDSEEDLRANLALVPEVGLGTSGPAALQNFVASAEANRVNQGDPGWTDPTPLVRTRPDLRQLPLHGGPGCQLTGKQAATLDEQSRKLRVYLTANAPVGADGRRPAADLLCAKLRDEMHGKKPEWLRPEAIPALLQLLMHEDPPVRHMLVELLSEIPGSVATIALAKRALFDLDGEIRHAAVEALRSRDPADYRPIFVRGFRYPWAPVADHAAEALIALNEREAVPELVTMLGQPDPALPVPLPGNRLVVREVVRAKHLTNCMLCHPPSMNGKETSSLGVDPVLTMAFPTASLSNTQNPRAGGLGQSSAGSLIQQALARLANTGGCHDYSNVGATSPGQTTVINANQGNNSVTGTPGQSSPALNAGGRGSALSARVAAIPPGPRPTAAQPRFLRTANASLMMVPLVIRGDITYLRQDFSVQQPIVDAPASNGPVPRSRFDYFLRTRDANAAERLAAKVLPPSASYPQRDAVLTALRALTGKDAGPTTVAWQELFPQAEIDVRAARVSQDVVKAGPVRQQILLTELRDAKGLVNTVALARAVRDLRGDAQTKARQYLADRLARMTAATLRDKLADDDAEVRHAAVLASVRKGKKELVPDLIALLDVEEPATSRLAEAGLKELTGQDFVAPAAWRTWWSGKAEVTY
jgi:HEAT repeat protein